ncbi:MAG: hypothetical protein QXP81_05085 [Nitrososphaerota archaeon]
MQVDESTILLVLIVAVTASIVAGNFIGRRRVESVTEVLRRSLTRMGAEVRVVRRSSSMALVSGKRLGELVEFSVLVGIVPRSNAFGFVAARLAGRRDLVMLRGAVARPPVRSVALLRKGTPAVRSARAWGEHSSDLGDFVVAYDGPPPSIDEDLLRSLSGTSVLLLAVRPELPHVYAYIELRGDLDSSVEAVVRSIGPLLEALASERPG